MIIKINIIKVLISFNQIKEIINSHNQKKCFDCNNNIFFKDIKIHNDDQTLNEIIYKNKSISRFGDGEYSCIFGKKIRFQEPNKTLGKRLLNILNSREKNLLIGINFPFRLKDIDRFNIIAKNYYKKLIKVYKFNYINLFKNKEYYSSRITRFYIDYESKKKVPKYIKKIKKIWDNREVVFVEGDKSRLGVGNDLFSNAKSIQRIICPSINAFNYYNDIINEIENKVNKNKLILIALGPTATILSYDLYKLGYQAIDIGHIDIEYEWYLRKTLIKIPINNKYVAESKKMQGKFTSVKDKNYYKQIIGKIPE